MNSADASQLTDLVQSIGIFALGVILLCNTVLHVVAMRAIQQKLSERLDAIEARMRRNQ